MLIAVVIGARMLDEGRRQRLTAAAIVLAGLVLLVISR